MEYRPCIISYRLAGSVKVRPILTGGRLTRVANITGFTIFRKRMEDTLASGTWGKDVLQVICGG